MSENALHFRNDGADVFRALGYGDTEEFLHGSDIGVVVRHRTDIIQPVGVRNDLHVRQAFSQLFHSPMEIAEIRRGFDDPFTIQLEDDPHDTMRAGMLRSHVQQEFFPSIGRGGIGVRQEHLPIGFGDLAVDLFHRRLIKSWDKVKLTAPATSLGGEIFSQGIAFGVVFGEENTAQIRMPGESDPHHVVHFALQKVCATPDARDRIKRGVLFREPGFEADPLSVGN